MKRKYSIRDPIMGDIKFSETEKKVIDLPEFQRLRRVKQLATAYLVYPGAMHTRFEHSLGTMEMTYQFLKSMEEAEEDEKELMRLVGLLHDVGHCAFSHDGENALGINHEEKGMKIIRSSEIRDIICEHYSLEEFENAYRGRGLGMIVCSAIGSDRLDYLIRDAYYTGVAYGVIDKERLLQCINLSEDNKLFVEEKDIAVIESVLIARFLMFTNVYNHKTVRICSAMLRKAVHTALVQQKFTEGDFYRFGDQELLMLMGKDEKNTYALELRNRKLWKKIDEIDYSEFLNCIGRKKTQKAAMELEKELERRFEQEFIVDLPVPSYKEPEIRVVNERHVFPFVFLSPLVSALKDAEKERLKVFVLCREPDKVDRRKLKSYLKEWFQ